MTDTPKLKPVLGSFVVALTDDEMTKIGHPYIVHSLWTDENGGHGVSVALWDGCGAGLNEGEYELLTRTAPQVKPLDDVALDTILRDTIYPCHGDVEGIDDAIKAILSALE